MLSFTHLLLPVVFWLAGVSGELVMTQTPSILPVTVGQTATITCKASNSISNYLSWYQQKAGERPKLLIYDATTLYTGTPARFSGHQSSTTFTMTITGVQPEDFADYYCMGYQSSSNPYTFGKGTELVLNRDVAKPVLTLLPPSTEEISKGTATLLCLANHFSPNTLQLVWQKDMVTVTDGVKTSGSVTGSDHSYSVSSTLTLPAQVWASDARFSCVVTHESLMGPLTQTIRATECV
uniref:Ig lambda-like chain, V-C region n=1 Tax=Callorhinchus milii TaxID=7868 RepID=K4G4T3_CALMI|nr:Ig lambda-like chain, V-C region [Callorhinchus milii]